MYKIKIHSYEKKYLLDEMIKVFLSPDEYVLVEEDDTNTIHFNLQGSQDKNVIKREIFNKLSKLTDHRPEWGILTGIRPVKLWGETLQRLGDICEVRNFMKEEFLLSDKKIDLLEDIYNYQIKSIGGIDERNSSMYIGIPFCPTRCSYCSFASNQVPDTEIDKYFQALLTEIRAVGSMMSENRMMPRSIYIGGGTPTTFSAPQLRELFCAIKENIPTGRLKEMSLEAGRPDTITSEKLKAAYEGGVDRISINPQTMNDETLRRIGREHSSQMIHEAFKIAEKFPFRGINCDIIAGLPGETLKDFQNTLKKVIDLGPNNITIHSIAVKRGSKLIDIDRSYYHKIADQVGDMLMSGAKELRFHGFRPYYLYRQKHMAGAYENTGYCKDDNFCIYNMAIMDEHEDIVALGAGGISKAFYPGENRLERVPNVTNYQEYISRIDEMIERKRKGLFSR